jgi:hypothetical protein
VGVALPDGDAARSHYDYEKRNLGIHSLDAALEKFNGCPHGRVPASGPDFGENRSRVNTKPAAGRKEQRRGKRGKLANLKVLCSSLW